MHLCVVYDLATLFAHAPLKAPREAAPLHRYIHGCQNHSTSRSDQHQVSTEEQPFGEIEALQFLQTAFQEVDVPLMCLGSCSQSYCWASLFFTPLLVRPFRIDEIPIFFLFLFFFPKPPRISSEHSPKLQIRSHSYLRAVSEVSINRSLDSLDPAGLLTSPKFRSRNESYMRAMSTISQVGDTHPWWPGEPLPCWTPTEPLQ